MKWNTGRASAEGGETQGLTAQCFTWHMCNWLYQLVLISIKPLCHSLHIQGMGMCLLLVGMNTLACNNQSRHQGLYSLSGKTSYRKISWSLEAARFGFKLLQSLWNLAGTSAALLPMCLSNFRAIRPLQHPISRLREFTRFGGKTSYRLVNRGPGARGV